MPVRNGTLADETILRLKSEGLSFRDISKQLGKSLGSVTGRYYRLKGVRHPSQLERDAQLKRDRELRRAARKKRNHWPRSRQRSSSGMVSHSPLRLEGRVQLPRLCT